MDVTSITVECGGQPAELHTIRAEVAGTQYKIEIVPEHEQYPTLVVTDDGLTRQFIGGEPAPEWVPDHVRETYQTLVRTGLKRRAAAHRTSQFA